MREICVKGQKMVVGAISGEPDLAWVNVSSLVIDDAYQRPLGKGNWRSIRKIAENFDWSMFTPVVVSKHGDRYALIDGQHRAHAAALRGITSIPAMIVDLPTEGQARAFSWINGSATKITNFHVYRAALAAQEDWAVRSRAAVEASGCRLMESNKSSGAKKSGEIFCISLIREIVLGGHDKAVTDGLAAIRSIDVNGTRAALYSGDLLRPWLKAVAATKYGDLAEVLRTEDPYRTFDRAVREGESRKGSKSALYRDAFLSRINEQKRSRRAA